MYVIHHFEQVYTCLRSNDEQICRRLGHKKHDRNKPSSQGATLFEELVPMYIIFYVNTEFLPVRQCYKSPNVVLR